MTCFGLFGMWIDWGNLTDMHHTHTSAGKLGARFVSCHGAEYFWERTLQINLPSPASFKLTLFTCFWLSWPYNPLFKAKGVQSPLHSILIIYALLNCPNSVGIRKRDPLQCPNSVGIEKRYPLYCPNSIGIVLVLLLVLIPILIYLILIIDNLTQ